MKNLVYLAVTADKYELPLALFNDYKEACKYSGKTKNSFKCSVSRNSLDRTNKCRYVSVKINEI